MTDPMHNLGARLAALPPILKEALAKTPSSAMAAQSFLMPRNGHPNSLRDHDAWLQGHPATPTGRAAFLRLLRGAMRARPVWRGDVLPDKAGLLVLSHYLGGAPSTEDGYYGSLLSATAPGGPTVVAEINHTWGMPPHPTARTPARVVLARGVPIWRSAQHARALREAGRSIGHNCTDRALAEHVRAGSLSASNLFAMGLASQVAKLVTRLRPEALLLTWEGHPWERLVIAAAKQAQPNIKCIAYHHAVLFAQQTATGQALGAGFDPDMIVTSGAQAEGWYRAQPDWSETPVEGVGSPRGDGTIAAKATTGNTVLVAPEGILDETVALFRVALATKAHGAPQRFALRLHPVLPRTRVLQAMPELETLPEGIGWSDGGLAEALGSARAVLYRGSTVCVQALQHGVRPIYLDTPGSVQLNPLSDTTGWCLSAQDALSLIAMLATDSVLPIPDRDMLFSKALPVARTIFAPSDPAKLTSLLHALCRP
jgi:hypothetical protein